jgi:aryl-alcohol dehydrogenase-like predicted oxidoreductase
MSAAVVGGGGVSVSEIGLGGFELGPEDGEQPDLERAKQVISTALDAGVNWIDTSERYHDLRNEALIGEALAGTVMLVASKVAPNPRGSGFRPAEIRAGCLASMKRLRRDRIDIYFLHWPDETGVPLEETWGAMSDLVDEGLVRAIGLSNYPLEDVERCHRQRPVDAIQDGLSLVDYLHNRTLFAACAELGIAGVVFEPLGSGALTGRSINAVRESWAGYTDWPFYQRLLEGTNGDRTAEVIEGVRSHRRAARRLGCPGRARLGPRPIRRYGRPRRHPQRRPPRRKRERDASRRARRARRARQPHGPRPDGGVTQLASAPGRAFPLPTGHPSDDLPRGRAPALGQRRRAGRDLP